MVAHASTWEAEVGGSQASLGHIFRPHLKTKQNKNNERKKKSTKYLIDKTLVF
jgi:hypothetical protein